MNDYIKHIESKSPLLKAWGELYDIKEKLKRKYELEKLGETHSTDYIKLCDEIRKWAHDEESR